MNNYNKFNNQQKLRRKFHSRRNDFISRVWTISHLGWRYNITSHNRPRIHHNRHGINRLIRKREKMENNITKVEPKNIEIKPKAKLTIEGMVHNQEFLKKTYHDFIFDN